MLKEDASDLYMKEEGFPFLRVGGKLARGEQVLDRQEMDRLLLFILGREGRERFYREKEEDTTFEYSGRRFRANLFCQRGKVALVVREIKKYIPTFGELNLPSSVLARLSSQRRGMVIITGPAGCGKSTTLASMLEYINKNFPYHIISIEDPIEFILEEKQSLINQREVGKDTLSFSRALRSVVRESSDVIMIGEIRDRETFETALNAAETGSLVLTTLHTIDAPKTVERILAFFPPQYQSEIRFRLSHLLKGIVSLRLLPSKTGRERIPAYSILLGTPTVRKYIQEGKIDELYRLMEEGKSSGMCTFNQILYVLVKEGKELIMRKHFPRATNPRN
ncbi:MAG: PilT/PilU family type 4a pilus ATPase [Caldiserica bacterium]|nr:PilT/PilU family type 4a pilus ATPase [Caldisericota bacterium]